MILKFLMFCICSMMENRDNVIDISIYRRVGAVPVKEG